MTVKYIEAKDGEPGMYYLSYVDKHANPPLINVVKSIESKNGPYSFWAMVSPYTDGCRLDIVQGVIAK